MKRLIHTSIESSNKRSFRYPQDIEEVEEFVNKTYNLKTGFLCEEICRALADMYSNIEAAKIDFMFMNGGLQQGGHFVCKVLGDAGQGCNLIDPTGDQFLGLDSNMKCAAFHRGMFGYLSNDYRPMNRIESSATSIWELIEDISENYPQVRLITL